jgi:hypothetical protein
VIRDGMPCKDAAVDPRPARSTQAVLGEPMQSRLLTGEWPACQEIGD